MKTPSSVSLLSKLAIMLAAILLSLSAMEVFIRWYHPYPDYRTHCIGAFPDAYDPTYGYRGIPNLHQRFILTDFDTSINNNSWGYRDTEWPETENRTRILVLGDSYAWGWGVSVEERFSGVLQKLNPEITVCNLAQPGYSTDQELLVLQNDGSRLKPALVLIQFCANDITDGNGTSALHETQPKPRFVLDGDKLWLDNYPVPYNEPFWKTKEAWANWYGSFSYEAFVGVGFPKTPSVTDLSPKLYQGIHVVNLAHRALTKLTSPRSKTHNPALADTLHDPSLFVEELELTVRIFKAVKNYCASRDIDLAVALVPSVFDQSMHDRLADLGIPCLQLAPALASSFRPLYFRHDQHWNERGHLLAGKAIHRFLRQEFPDLGQPDR